ncbi:MAG: hypothetical protein A2157_04480 [Deltaproteobacteria bacterium RBG_16_47_11]|nr:MAG: hypothetical protein A2157_04480 [Deltaproteobacteria bacterium RBG_16_47_11]
MKKRILVLIGLIVWVSWIMLSGQNSHAQVKEVKIGIILPLSGPLAPIGNSMKNGAELLAEEINNAGGIKSLKGAKVRLVFADSRGKPDVGMSEAERLINRENVSALSGAFQSAVTYTSTEVAERYKVPYLTSVAVMPEITGRGFKYVFRNSTPNSFSAKMRTEFAEEMEKKFGKGKRYTIGNLYENSDWGMSYGRLYREWVKSAGRTQVLDEAYSAGMSDVTPLIMKIKAAKPDILFLSCYLSDGILIDRGFAEHKVETNIISSGAEHGDPFWLKNIGRLSDFQVWCIPWDIRIMDSKAWIKPINERYKKKYGDDLGAWSASMYQDLSILFDALERAASDNRDKIREALAATKIEDPNRILVPHKVIQFGPDGQNHYAQDLLIQTVNFKHNIVWPSWVASPDYQLVWPQPTWEEKEKMGIKK